MSVEKRLLLMASILTVLASACYGPEPPVTAQPASLPPAPLECTVNPPGLELQADSLGRRQVTVSGEGFQPGEELVLVFSTQVGAPTGQKGVRHEVRPAQRVGEDGSFTWDQTMQPLDGNPTWNLAVVHARGVACINFTAP